MVGSNSLLFGAIADDLTGGVDLAAMLVARGVPTGCTVGVKPAIQPGNIAHVIALKTRVIPAKDAVSQVLEAADRLIEAGVRQIFFKYCATFDSTPEGNIGPCAEALLDKLGARATLFVPGLAETGRTVFQGHMFGGSQLLGESPKRFDPLTPMTDSNLVRVLQAQSKMKVGLLPHAVVNAGPQAIRASLAACVEEGQRLLIVDSIYEADLVAIASASFDLPMLTGNSAVTAHLPPAWLRSGLIGVDSLVPASLPAVDGPAAVLVGSVAGQTIAQLERFGRDNPVLTIDLMAAFAGEDVVRSARDFAQAHLPARVIAISTAAPQHAVDALQQTYGRATVADKAESILAAIAEILVQDLGVRRLIIAGGETSGSVVQALGIERLAMGPYQGLGVYWGIANLPDSVALMLKSGKQGNLDVFGEVLQEMKRPVSTEPRLDDWPPVRRFIQTQGEHMATAAI